MLGTDFVSLTLTLKKSCAVLSSLELPVKLNQIRQSEGIKQTTTKKIYSFIMI